MLFSGIRSAGRGMDNFPLDPPTSTLQHYLTMAMNPTHVSHVHMRRVLLPESAVVSTMYESIQNR